jgi:hypothetical protein
MHYKSGPKCLRWSFKDIGALKRTKDLQEILNRAKPDPQKVKESRREKFARKYSTVESLLLASCEALFNLNRYAKWQTCSRDHKYEIYRLKNEMIALLYDHGVADRVYLHKKQLPMKECFGCQGTGERLRTGEVCSKCDGTGVFQAEREVTLVVFSFVIGSEARRFTWHQPAERVNWHFEVTQSPGIWETSPAMPLEMPKSRFAEAKELIRYTLERLGVSAAATC